ncbi:hypothetical protein IWX78_000768 [Mycetocola sp. CAN_C7]|uniref:DUF7882 family protein n=1 Tax=Mycetocola sp. CAN_C7 TaxID=2787724 RepID=UPI0018C92278
MGSLLYASADHKFDDRLLGHIKVVITLKLRNREAFFLSWERQEDEGSGRVSIWISHDIPLQFRFIDLAPIPIDQAWTKALLDGSYGPRGLVVSGEPEAE